MLSVKIIVLQQVHLIWKMTPTQQGAKGPMLIKMAKIKMKDESSQRCPSGSFLHEEKEMAERQKSLPVL